MAKNDRLYLGNMLDASREAQELLAGMTRAQFDQDRKSLLALLHLVQIIGEAARRVSATTQQANVSIPWKQIIGMRHRIVHDYVNINKNVLWGALTVDIPPLIAELEQIIASLSKPPNP